jgi:hypothetical protein
MPMTRWVNADREKFPSPEELSFAITEEREMSSPYQR